MKIQINSLEALERMIGGDTAVEIEIRGSIVQEFAKKHLKAVAKSENVLKALSVTQDAIIAEAQKQLNEAVATFTQTYGGSIYNLKLNPKIEERIRTEVADKVERSVTDIVMSTLESRMTEENVIKMVEQRLEYHTNAMVKTAVQKKLQELSKQL